MQLAEFEEQISELEKRLSDPASYGLANDHQQIAAMANQLEELKAEIEGHYERWLFLEDKRQSATK